MSTTLAALTGITRMESACDCCGRSLGRVFGVRYPDGREMELGRVCAAKATGYRPNTVEREAASAARRAVVAARLAEVRDAFPGLTESLALDVAVTDAVWDGTAEAWHRWQDWRTMAAEVAR